MAIMRLLMFVLISINVNASSRARFSMPVNYNIGTRGDTFVGNRQPQNVVTGDFTGDGRLDLAVAHTADNSVYFLKGNGDGTFEPAVQIPIIGATIHGDLYVGDFNNDGRLDIFVSEDPLAHSLCRPIVLLNNGDGTFRVHIDNGSSFTVANTYARGWAVGDFNGDGKLDLVATLPNTTINDCGGFIVLLGKGDGTFTRGQVVTNSPGLLHYSRWVAVGDVNGDGKLDLAFADGLGLAGNTATAELTIMLGNGDGTFRLAGHYPSPGKTLAADENLNPENVHLADLNHDGKLDVIVSNYDDNINVFVNNGDGTFQPAVGYTPGEYPRAVSVADVDGDGNADLIVTNIGSATGFIDDNAPGSVAVMLGNGDGTFQAAIQFTPFYFPGCAVVADFNRHGRPDFAVTAMSEAGTASDHAVAVMLNIGRARFVAPKRHPLSERPDLR